jgi:hypothetical protein
MHRQWLQNVLVRLCRGLEGHARLHPELRLMDNDAPASASHTCVCSTSGLYDNAGLCSNVDECAAGGTAACQTFFSAGDGASCNDRGAPLTGHTCTCPAGSENVGGVCVEIDGCLATNDNGDLRCQADGHTGAVCVMM